MKLIIFLVLLNNLLYSDYTRMKICDFVNIVATQNSINIATDKKIEKEFDFFINKQIDGKTNVQVLIELLDQNGYILKKQSDQYYIIKSKEDLLINKIKIYKINYANTNQVKQKIEKILEGYFKNIKTIKTSSNNKKYTPMQENRPGANNTNLQIKETEEKINYSINLLDNKSIAVTYKDDFVHVVVEKIISSMDHEPKRIQVKLKIYEVNSEALKEFSTDLGVDLQINDITLSSSVNSKDGLIDLGLKKNSFIQNSSGFNLSTAIKALEKTGNAKIKSEPMVMLYEGNRAFLNEGKTYPIKTDDTIVSNENTTSSATYTNVDTGLMVGIRFHEFRNELIYLDLDLNLNVVESYDQDQKQIITVKRKLKTDLLIEPGFTIDMAGLTRSTERKSIGGIPVLKDIPVLGSIFSFDSNQNVQNMLVIQLRADIIKNKLEIAKKIKKQRKSNIKSLSELVNAPKKKK